VTHTHEVLARQEAAVHLDAGYAGVEKQPEVVQAQQDGNIRQDIEWRVAMRRSTITKMANGPIETLT
jgi:IS5 family transposase